MTNLDDSKTPIFAGSNPASPTIFKRGFRENEESYTEFRGIRELGQVPAVVSFMESTPHHGLKELGLFFFFARLVHSLVARRCPPFTELKTGSFAESQASRGLAIFRRQRGCRGRFYRIFTFHLRPCDTGCSQAW